MSSVLPHFTINLTAPHRLAYALLHCTASVVAPHHKRCCTAPRTRCQTAYLLPHQVFIPHRTSVAGQCYRNRCCCTTPVGVVVADSCCSFVNAADSHLLTQLLHTCCCVCFNTHVDVVIARLRFVELITPTA